MAPTDNRDRDRDQRALDRLPLLHISERDDVKPRVPLASSASPGDYSSDPYDRYRRAMSPAERRFLQTMPISRSNSLTVYPVQQYGSWPNMDGTAVASGDAKAEGANIDPALSAVRSAAEAAAAANNAAQAAAAPEIRVQPETLGSATDSPAIEIDPPAQPLAAAAPPTPAAVAASVPAAVAAAYKPDDPMNSLAPPGSDETPKKETPFSRSPELRISHKLAERKRRKEMRDLFDELREQLPADRGMKASKWEILSKAVDYIAHLKHRVDEMQRINEALHRDLAVARGENPNTPWPPAYHSFGNIPSYVPPAHATNAAAAAATTPAAAPLTPAAPPAPAAATTAAAVAAATATPTATPAPAAAPVVAPAPAAATAAPAPAPAAQTTPAVTTPVPAATPTPAPAAVPQAAAPAPATTEPAAPKSS